VACGAHPRSNPFLEGHGTQVGKPARRGLAGLIQNCGFPAMRDPRAKARVGAVDEASTAAREGACAPRDQPGSIQKPKRGGVTINKGVFGFSGRTGQSRGFAPAVGVNGPGKINRMRRLSATRATAR